MMRGNRCPVLVLQDNAQWLRAVEVPLHLHLDNW
jgi:hypothetical protein